MLCVAAAPATRNTIAITIDCDSRKRENRSEKSLERLLLVLQQFIQSFLMQTNRQNIRFIKCQVEHENSSLVSCEERSFSC